MATLSGVAITGGCRGPDPPPSELPSGVHEKSKNQVTIFFVEGVEGYRTADDELARTPPEPSIQTRLRRWLHYEYRKTTCAVRWATVLQNGELAREADFNRL